MGRIYASVARSSIRSSSPSLPAPHPLVPRRPATILSVSKSSDRPGTHNEEAIEEASASTRGGRGDATRDGM